MKWHLTGIGVFWSSWQLFSIVMTTASVTMLLPSNCICICIVQWQHVCGYLYVPDAAEEICDWCFVEVAVKQIGSHSYVADALPWRTYLHHHTHPHVDIIHGGPEKNCSKFCAGCAVFFLDHHAQLLNTHADIGRSCRWQGLLRCRATHLEQSDDVVYVKLLSSFHKIL